MRFSHLVICEHTPVRSVHRHRRQAVTVQPEHLLLLPVLDLPVAVEKRDDTPILPRHRTEILPRLPAEARFPSTFLRVSRACLGKQWSFSTSINPCMEM